MKKIQLNTLQGFTLIELIITIAIVAILMSLAVPSIRTMMANNQVAVTNNSIISALNLARSEAVTRANQVGVCPSNNGNGCNNGQWNTGWVVFDNLDGNGTPTNAERIRVDTRETTVTRSGFAGTIVFQANGTTTLAGAQTIKICFKNTNVTNKCRSITISRFGSVKSTKTTA